ncbi:hypothetical protein BCR34DRAFT_556823 [Clohesyomyces aquaticus]|uniref:Uncharacterized protein n=1 Tax=Clohesyomyces aquaticus TaxID=1231657 RepID=A0A1Y2A205_9PLEO|nr:hypothetical protein BCR34DRAFT_556823 [Clohesyomyces aquaticus]
MPPRKINQETLQALLEQHRIDFEGPVAPHKWKQQDDHFHVIRKISKIRYDDYKSRRNSGKINKQWWINQQRRVKDLAERAKRLRNGAGVNEATWRDIENLVIARFENWVICRRCGDENWISELEAYPMNDAAKTELRDKRASRVPCSCDLRPVVSRKPNNDDETGPIFSHSVSQKISHVPEDCLEKGIPMSPDRVIGLNLTNAMAQYTTVSPSNLTYSPVQGMPTLLTPFLVIEAKKEHNTPGFRSIERQTAFTIRRLLKIQHQVQNGSEIRCDPPLVWFFAYQGEIWRLYAATLDPGNSNHVRVYEIWLGTVESDDGALQILQIADYIWTWARDIYRHQIRQCLVTHGGFRHISPAATDPFRASPSLISDRGTPSISQVLGRSNTIGSLEPGPSAPDEMEVDDSGLIYINTEDASVHPFLRWARASELTSTSIRHSNIIAFSFRYLDIRASDTLRSSEHLRQIYDNAIAIHSKDLHGLEAHWLGSVPRPRNSDRIFRVSLVFSTYCQRDNWQITRQISCFVWGMDDPTPSEVSISFQALRDSLEQLRAIKGRRSVSCAFRNTSLVISPIAREGKPEQEVQWILPRMDCTSDPATPLLFQPFDTPTEQQDNEQRDCQASFQKLRILLPTEQDAPRCPALETTPDDISHGDGVVAVKGYEWPSECPRFCLFVFNEHGFDDGNVLSAILRQCIQRGEYCGYGNTPFSETDKQTLRHWLKALER